MDSFETMITHIDIICEATRGSLLYWHQPFPEVKMSQITMWRYWYLKFRKSPECCDKLLFLGKDLQHYSAYVEYQETIRKKLSMFAQGLRHLQSTYNFHHNIRQSFEKLLIIVAIIAEELESSRMVVGHRDRSLKDY